MVIIDGEAKLGCDCFDKRKVDASSEGASREKVLTVSDVEAAMADHTVVLEGRMTPDVLRNFVSARGYTSFSEVMAEGTDSWINVATVYLEMGGVDLSGVIGMEDAKLKLEESLDRAAVEEMVRQTVKDVDVVLDGGITFSF